MMTKRTSTKVANFMTSWAGVLVIGCGHMINVNELLRCFLYISITFEKESGRRERWWEMASGQDGKG